MNVWTELMFLQGHIASPALALRLVADERPDTAEAKPAPAADGRPGNACAARRASTQPACH